MQQSAFSMTNVQNTLRCFSFNHSGDCHIAANYHRTHNLVSSLVSLLEQDSLPQALVALGNHLASHPSVPYNYDRRTKEGKALDQALTDFQNASNKLSRALEAYKPREGR